MHKEVSSLDRFLFIYRKLIKKNSKIGIYANQISFSFLFKKYIYELIPSQKVFLLEHGFFSEIQDQISLTDTEIYQQFSPIEWISLYGKTYSSLYPSLDTIKDLDFIIIDIQDVGSRYYTFLTSVYFLLEKIYENQLGLNLIVIDRKNPIVSYFRKRKFEGTPLNKKYESFVGIEGILHQHGLSSAELIYYFVNVLKKKYKSKNKIYVIPFSTKIPVLEISKGIQKLNIETLQSNLPKYIDQFSIFPSPNMPAYQTAVVYTGQCLLEGTNLSEGRGTTKPFEIFGAPYLTVSFIKELANDKNLEKLGALLRPIKFIPTFNRYANQICYGWQIHPQKNYHSLLSSIYILHKIKKHFKEFDWYRETYEFKNEYFAIEYLLGDSIFLDYLLHSKYDFDFIIKYTSIKEKEWSRKVQQYYFY